MINKCYAHSSTLAIFEYLLHLKNDNDNRKQCTIIVKLKITKIHDVSIITQEAI